MTNDYNEFSNNFDSEYSEKPSFPPELSDSDTDPIPYLFWNMFALTKEIEDLKNKIESIKFEEIEELEEIEKKVEGLPEAIGRALAGRNSDLGPIPENAGEKVPWDEFFVWDSNN